jgi:Protein phosphatase 2C
VAGVRHRLAGQGPEDSFAWAVEEDRLVVAVADGVGSVTDSAGTAERACRAAVSATVGMATTASPTGADEHPATGPAGARQPGRASGWARPPGAARNGVDAANRAAEGGGATTIVVASLTSDGRVELARVGDTTAFVVHRDGSSTELFEPPDPERVDTTTAALPATAPLVEAAELILEPGQVLVVVTDGIAGPWRDGPTTVAPGLASVLLGHPGPTELLEVADFSRLGCHDDRTAVGVWLRTDLPGVGQGVDAGAVQRPHLDHVPTSGDQPGDEDAEGGEDAPSHAGPDQQNEPYVGGEDATVAETHDHQGGVPAARQLVTGERDDPSHAQNHEEGGLPEGHLAQQLDHPHRPLNLATSWT